MTQREYMQTASDEDLADLLCYVITNTLERADADIDTCKACPASRWCRKGHNGFIDWLKEEA